MTMNAVKRIYGIRSTRAARAYGARNPCLSPTAISPAGTGNDKASYSHYDVIGDWGRAVGTGHAQRNGRTDALRRLNIRRFETF